MSPFWMYVALALAMVGCGEPGTTPALIDAGPVIDTPRGVVPCDTIAQDCPSGEKCTFMRNPQTSGPPIIAMCVAAGTVPENAACTYNAAFRDDCAAGFSCSQGFCRRLCNGPDACGANQHCLQQSTLSDGVCEDPCTLFDPSTCAAGFSCGWGGEIGDQVEATLCVRSGSTPDGAACNFGECVPNTGCGSPELDVCTALCDASHPCAIGTCQAPIASQPEVQICY